MRTTKPISTISFNTTEFLYLKLEELQKAGIISFWAFICHLPEDDEGGKKSHHHVYIEPSKMLQTDDLKKALLEFDPNSDKPLGTINWRSSKFDPWYMYALHDKKYLASKNESRKYSYGYDEFFASDMDELNCKVHEIDLLALSPYQAILDAQSQGLTWSEFFARGTVPLPQIALYERAWNLLSSGSTDRGGHSPHQNEPDLEF